MKRRQYIAEVLDFPRRGAAELWRRAGFQVGGLAALVNLKLVPGFHWKSMELRTVIDYG